MNPNSKPRLCADVFCMHDMTITHDTFINGDFYCKGSIYESEEHDDLTLEVQGDLFVDGLIYFSNVTVHGNLYCGGISCINLTVLGDILISGNENSSREFIGQLDSSHTYCDANISVLDTIFSQTLIANGLVTATSIDVDDILAGEMNVSDFIAFNNEILCTGHIKCQELWSPNFTEDPPPKVRAKSISSKNFVINC